MKTTKYRNLIILFYKILYKIKNSNLYINQYIVGCISNLPTNSKKPLTIDTLFNFIKNKLINKGIRLPIINIDISNFVYTNNLCEIITTMYKLFNNSATVDEVVKNYNIIKNLLL